MMETSTSPPLMSTRVIAISFFFFFLTFCVCISLHDTASASASPSKDGLPYDNSAYSKCQTRPEDPLYGGGILRNLAGPRAPPLVTSSSSPAFLIGNLTVGTRYTFSCWAKIKGANASIVTARLSIDNNSSSECVGSVLARRGCWSFLKGGFVLDQDSSESVFYFQAAYSNVSEIRIVSASLQPFTVEQWKIHQEDNIKSRRKREVIVHVSDSQGNRIAEAQVQAQQLSKDFPFGSAIAETILDNAPYQAWFVDRFTATVFENELKWYFTEPDPGEVNYTIADDLLKFSKSHNLTVRGHNIFWEDPKYTPSWVRNLSGDALRAAVDSRISSLMTRYREDFVHWDVSNEMLHFRFYEKELGTKASVHFFETARHLDPLATLFMNDFNVVESCDDERAAPDLYVSILAEVEEGDGGGGGGFVVNGIGLEGHFGKPNIPLMRAVLDKLATLGLPIWLTEVDISSKFDQKTQALFVEEVLREGFSHPSIEGIMLWSALHPNGCYQMCLTDPEFHNLPTGDVVDDLLLREWQTKKEVGETDKQGSVAFDAFLGEYKIIVNYVRGNVAAAAAAAFVSVSRGDDTIHVEVVLQL